MFIQQQFIETCLGSNLEFKYKDNLTLCGYTLLPCFLPFKLLHCLFSHKISLNIFKLLFPLFFFKARLPNSFYCIFLKIFY